MYEVNFKKRGKAYSKRFETTNAAVRFLRSEKMPVIKIKKKILRSQRKREKRLYKGISWSKQKKAWLIHLKGLTKAEKKKLRGPAYYTDQTTAAAWRAFATNTELHTLKIGNKEVRTCLLYTSDAADE